MCIHNLSRSVKALSACTSIRLVVRCFHAIFLPTTRRFRHFMFALCFASGLRYWFRILLCFGLSFFINLSFVLIYCFDLHDLL